MSEALLLLLKLNGVVAVAVAFVLALRLPARRLFGARIAYGLWALVPLTALAMLVPARVVTVIETVSTMAVAPVTAEVAGPVVPAAPTFDPWPLLAALWVAGGLASLAWLVWRQAQFGRALAERRAGPAVIGVLRPRVVTPADFTQRYTPKEQLVVLAHERTHIARHDSRINAAVALVRCVNWFNPAIHLLAHYLRIDQEFACDAQVVAAHPTARRSYAEAMLKAQLAARPLPMGCYWPASSAHPLAQRVRLLSRPTPDRARRRLGTLAVALVTVGGAWSAWASRPAELRVTETPHLAWTTQPAAPKVTPPPTVIANRAEAPPPARSSDRAPAAEQPSGPQPMVEAQAPHADPDPTPDPRFEDRDWTPRVRKIYAVARQSSIQPGLAVRLRATMVDRDGVSLVTDMTAYGSQSLYRTGYFQQKGSHYRLFTRVRQDGGRLLVTASLDDRFQPETSGTISMMSGETGRIVLGDGQTVTVTPTVRVETPEEFEEGQRARRERDADRERGRRFLAALSSIPY